MDIQFKKLTPDMADDFISYFDNAAFSDHEDWKGCYCLESHLPREENEKDMSDGKIIHIEERRKKARELIENGIMTGYLVYYGDEIAAWCNTGDKTNYFPICDAEELFGTDGLEKGRIKVLYCINIARIIGEKGLPISLWSGFLRTRKKRGIPMLKAIPFRTGISNISIKDLLGCMRNSDLNVILIRNGSIS